ncbi:MAG TPA: NADH-quinone oxidoreductase subunit NuoN [Gammaproteobacteria bacterium]|jgi:NADH-quinone oxidoreductase subunit N|nr:NADH-quinone oxidoreductase subunit NuoN [Gammaproteobacteria bacterium]
MDMNYAAAAPEIFLGVAICVVLLADVFLRDDQRNVTYVLSMLALIGTAAVTALYSPTGSIVTFSGSFVTDPASAVLKIFAYVTVGVTFLYSREYLQVNGLLKGEFFVLGLFGLLGIMIMISAHSLLTLYLGLEVLALSQYTLVAFNRDSAASAEAAMKYFVLGAIASGVLLYGISLLYGITGTLQLDTLAARVATGSVSIPVVLALAFIVVGVAFKFGAVPFHMWLPDVYQGAPTPVTLFIGSVPKIASFALAWRVLVEGLGPVHDAGWRDMLIVLCVLSLGLGNLVAIAQTNLKRMLAYSTISHVGFILMGFIAGNEEGVSAAMFYTFAYVLMAAAGFGMIILLSRRGFEAERLEDFKGLNARSPWFALVMLMIMFSMAGVPPFIGFYAKLVVLLAVLNTGLVWLAGVGMLFAVIGAYYYLRVVWYMYFADPVDNTPLSAAADMRIVISANALGLLILGVFPGGLLDLCARVLGA